MHSNVCIAQNKIDKQTNDRQSANHCAALSLRINGEMAAHRLRTTSFLQCFRQVERLASFRHHHGTVLAWSKDMSITCHACVHRNHVAQGIPPRKSHAPSALKKDSITLSENCERNQCAFALPIWKIYVCVCQRLVKGA